MEHKLWAPNEQGAFFCRAMDTDSALKPRPIPRRLPFFQLPFFDGIDPAEFFYRNFQNRAEWSCPKMTMTAMARTIPIEMGLNRDVKSRQKALLYLVQPEIAWFLRAVSAGNPISCLPV